MSSSASETRSAVHGSGMAEVERGGEGRWWRLEAEREWE
jgi:hypothetical protein